MLLPRFCFVLLRCCFLLLRYCVLSDEAPFSQLGDDASKERRDCVWLDFGVEFSPL